MKAVPVSELKAELSRHLRYVRRGGEVQILERGVPIARLVGLQGVAHDDSGRLVRLVRGGVLRPGSGEKIHVLDEPPLTLPGARLSEALDEDRGDRV